MMSSQVLLGVPLLALLILDVNGFSVKGSKHQHQSSSGTNAGGNLASQRAGSGHTAPVSYSAPSGVYKQPSSHPQFVQTAPVLAGVSSMPVAGSSPVSIPVQSGFVGAYMPVAAGYYSAAYMPGSAPGAQQTGGSQSYVPEAKWAIAPQAFEEQSNTEAQDSSSFLPPPSGPPAPALQSGETSNVVKEAELGNYQQQTEEFGYPAGNVGPGPGLPPVAMPYFGVGGLWGFPSPYPMPYPFPYPYPEFDYRLLYGLYPPGTYTTFSKEHEKGKDYYQTAHYLKEHESEAPQTPQNPGSGQQVVYPSVTQRN